MIEFLGHLAGRAACLTLGLHGRSCRGRVDHDRWVGYTWTGRGRWVR